MPSILIVDDDALIRVFLRRVFENVGFKVVEACNGNECIDLYEMPWPSVVMMDIVMPEKDGITALKQIKKINRDQKIIAISGGSVFTPETYLKEAKAAGADCIMAKPFCKSSLLFEINTLLG